MQDPRYLYALFAFLTIVLVLTIFGIYRFTSTGSIESLSAYEVPIPADLKEILEEETVQKSWIYRMHLHQKQNTFSYPRTVYHINLN